MDAGLKMESLGQGAKRDRRLTVLAVLTCLAIFVLSAATVVGEGLGPAWQSGTVYPVRLQLQSCFSNSDFGYMYCVGGFDGSSYHNDVRYSSISGGAVGQWLTTTSYPLSVAGESCVTYTVFVYCVGGYDGSARLKSFYYSQPSYKGTGTWTSAPSYPKATELQSCAVYSGYMYCVGGFDGIHYLNATYYVQLQASGGSGSWSQTTSFPTNIEGQSCAAYSGHIYCVGGYDGSKSLSQVYYAAVSSSGIGNWSTTTSYPSAVYGQSCSVWSGYLYCVGGFAKSAVSNSVYYGNILSTGGIGGWTATQSYPLGVENGSCAVLSAYIYCVGGSTINQASNLVYSDSISAVQTTVTSVSSATVTTTLPAYTTINQTVTSTETTTATLPTTVVISTVTETAASFSVKQVTVTSTSTSTVLGGTATTTVSTTVQQGQGMQPMAELLGAAAVGVAVGLFAASWSLRRRRRGPSAGAAQPEQQPEVKAAKLPPSRTKRVARYLVYAALTIVVLLVTVNGGLFILGLGSIGFGSGSGVGSGMAVDLSVPNESFVPIQGKVMTQFYSSTGSLLASDSAPFNLAPRSTTSVPLELTMPAQAQGNVVVKMTFDIDILGYYLPISGGSVTLPASFG